VTFAMGDGVPMATGAAVVLFVLFGLCMAVIADSYHSLIAECTSKESRAGVISVVWVVMILSTIFSAVVMNAVRPEFSRRPCRRCTT
jgi:Na+/melibiose symporter-like transporter